MQTAAIDRTAVSARLLSACLSPTWRERTAQMPVVMLEILADVVIDTVENMEALRLAVGAQTTPGALPGKSLDDVAAEHAQERAQAAADAPATDAPASTRKPRARRQAEPVAADAPAPAPAPAEPEEFDPEALRADLMRLGRAVGVPILAELGAMKFSDVAPADYPALSKLIAQAQADAQQSGE